MRNNILVIATVVGLMILGIVFSGPISSTPYKYAFAGTSEYSSNTDESNQKENEDTTDSSNDDQILDSRFSSEQIH